MVMSADLRRYYGSPEWAAKRLECWRAWNYKCSVCDLDYSGVCPLQCHHLPGAYAKLGHEDVWNDLRPLCVRHHPKGRLTLDGIRLSRKAYQWNKRIRWCGRMLARGLLWCLRLAWRGIRWLVLRRPTAAR